MRKFRESLSFSLKGLFLTHNTQRNFRIQTFFGIIVLILSLILKLSSIEALWILFSVMLVLLMESLNTVLEKMLDFLHPEYNQLVGVIKDIAASVVLIASVFAVVVGAIIFGKAIFNWGPEPGIIVALVFILFIKIFARRFGVNKNGKAD